jgi:hypothetical protein
MAWQFNTCSQSMTIKQHEHYISYYLITINFGKGVEAGNSHQ